MNLIIELPVADLRKASGELTQPRGTNFKNSSISNSSAVIFKGLDLRKATWYWYVSCCLSLRTSCSTMYLSTCLRVRRRLHPYWYDCYRMPFFYNFWHVLLSSFLCFCRFCFVFVFVFVSCSRWSFVDGALGQCPIQQTTYRIGNRVYYRVCSRFDRLL